MHDEGRSMYIVKKFLTFLKNGKLLQEGRESDFNSEYSKDSWRFRAESRRRGLVDGKVLRGDMDARWILAKLA